MRRCDFSATSPLGPDGLPPGSQQVRAFIDDPRPTRVKRAEVIDQLIGNDDYVEYWTNKWSDLLQVNRKFLGSRAVSSFASDS